MFLCGISPADPEATSVAAAGIDYSKNNEDFYFGAHLCDVQVKSIVCCQKFLIKSDKALTVV